MKQLLQQYAQYNTWANKIIIDQANQLSKEQLQKEIVSSFPGIYKTIVHLMDVESIWWQRLKLAEHVEWPGKNFNGGFDELSKRLLQLSQQWGRMDKKCKRSKYQSCFCLSEFKKRTI